MLLLPSVASASSFSPTTSYPEDVLHERARLGTPTHAKQRQTHDEGEQCPKEKDRSLKTAPRTVEIRRHRERVFDSCSPAYSFLRRFILCLFFLLYFNATFFLVVEHKGDRERKGENERAKSNKSCKKGTRVSLSACALARQKCLRGVYAIKWKREPLSRKLEDRRSRVSSSVGDSG